MSSVCAWIASPLALLRLEGWHAVSTHQLIPLYGYASSKLKHFFAQLVANLNRLNNRGHEEKPLSEILRSSSRPVELTEPVLKKLKFERTDLNG